MLPKFFIGIDISKLTLDFAVLSAGSTLTQVKIDNTEASIKELLKTLKADFGCTRFNTFYCAESMGIYSTFLLNVCLKKSLVFCQESPLQIKQSLGIQRGKSDALDSIRIAQYASKNYKQLKIWQPPRKLITHLKSLSSLRKRLLKAKVVIGTSKKIESYYYSKSEMKEISLYTGPGIKAIEETIAKIDTEIETIIVNDERLSSLMKIVTSVPKVGKIIGTEVIIYTNEFDPVWTAKKFASYCGVAPFERTSGTSVKGKPRVSHIANKELKSLFHMAALGTVRSKASFLRKYYERKVKEGKNKMSVLNAIKNKLIHRIFSCVRNNQLFVENSI